MSLLLDALKKAAEQKARQAEAESGKSGDDRTEELSAKDDTVVTEDSTIVDEDRTEVLDDDTEISEDPTMETTRTSRADEDVTDVYDQDETHSYPDDPEDDTRIDDTHIDDTDILEEERSLVGSNAAEDETTSIEEITQHTHVTDDNEETEFDPVTEYDSTTDDDTVLDSDDEAEQTEFTVEYAAQQNDSDVTMRSSDEDEITPINSERDVAEFMGDSVDDSTQSLDDPTQSTDYSTQSLHDPTQSIDDSTQSMDDSTQSLDEDTDHTGDSDEDLSLLLVEQEDDSTTKKSPYLESGENDAELESLSLVDQVQESATQTSTITDQNRRAASQVELESLRHEQTIIRPDATSTHTYAPDNYDRTLIRPPTDDASRIFAGMKAEEDVLMTPDYAKRVFLSKSSANRAQHYKVYAGIGLSIFLAIGIFSMFELVDESNLIDSTMSPLKRDPMPGIIRNDKNQGNVNVLDAAAEPDVDLETLKLVESAGTEPIVEDAVNEDTEISSSENAPESSEDVQSQSGLADNQVNNGVDSSDKPVEPANEPTQVAKTETTSTTSSLQISSSSKVSKVDQWLTDGYAAYQNGDDETALQNYNRVLELEPSNRNALLARAAIKVQNGDTSSAILDYQELLLANPKDSLAMSSLISIARTAPQESESQLKLMIRDEPASPHLNFVLANVYSAQNRWQEAQGLYFIALQNKPGDPNYAYNLAVSLEHISKPEAAITYYERAVANIRNGLATFDKNLVDSRIEMLKQL